MRTEIRRAWGLVRTGANCTYFIPLLPQACVTGYSTMKNAPKPFYRRKIHKNPIKQTPTVLTADPLISNNFNQLAREGVWHVALWR